MSEASTNTQCSYCGLPVLVTARDPSGPMFCCLGCRLAARVSAESGQTGHNRWLLVRLGWSIFFTLNASVFTMALWTLDVYDPATITQQTALVMNELFRYLALLFSLPVLLLLGSILIENVWENLRQGQVTTDLLLATGVVASFAYSAISVFRGSGHVYFEVGCIVLVAVTVGRWLEATGKLRVTETLRSLEKLLPETVRNWTSGSEESIPLKDANTGMLLRVLPGERIPVDGVMERNPAAIDEQLITGESQWAIKEPGDRVFAGTLNVDGDLWIRVTAAASSGTLRRLIDAVCAAATSKSRIQLLADRIAKWLVPAVMVLSVVVFVARYRAVGFEAALMASMAVIVIACPCALGVATPLAIWASIGRAARLGIFFRNGDSFGRLASIRAICFDKTGTLTTGTPEVSDVFVDESTTEDELFRAAHSLASSSTHSLASAIKQYVETMGRPNTDKVSARLSNTPRKLQTVPGRGIIGGLEQFGATVYLGSVRLMSENNQIIPVGLGDTLQRHQSAGSPIVCVGWSGVTRGVFVFREQIRQESSDVIQALQQANLPVLVLTGDPSTRAQQIGESLGVTVQTNLLPEDKLSEIRRIQREKGVVAMVGDGVNDAPALAAADVGIALGCGADISRDAADVCLLKNDLSQIPVAISIAQDAVRAVRFNVFWAFAFNAVGIGLATTGYVNPIFAAIAMIASSVIVIGNSIRNT